MLRRVTLRGESNRRAPGRRQGSRVWDRASGPRANPDAHAAPGVREPARWADSSSATCGHTSYGSATKAPRYGAPHARRPASSCRSPAKNGRSPAGRIRAGRCLFDPAAANGLSLTAQLLPPSERNGSRHVALDRAALAAQPRHAAFAQLGEDTTRSAVWCGYRMRPSRSRAMTVCGPPVRPPLSRRVRHSRRRPRVKDAGPTASAARYGAPSGVHNRLARSCAELSRRGPRTRIRLRWAAGTGDFPPGLAARRKPRHPPGSRPWLRGAGLPPVRRRCGSGRTARR